jgi:aspartate-semialdehyde dehydrogenase
MKKVNIAIVGATGMVGRTFLKVLEERDFPYENIYCFASKRSAGAKVKCKGVDIEVEELTASSFDRDIDIALFSAGGATSEKYAPIAASKGVIVIDNSSHFRMDEKVPLVVPEVNPEAIWNHQNIIANPNCSTIQAMVALKPLQEKYGLKRVILSTYQAVSGSGVKGVKDLENGLKGEMSTEAYAHPIANNCLPHIDVFMDNGYTKEEMKMILEAKKILNDQDLKVTATAVRVPVFDSHSEAINVELNNSFDIEDIFALYQNDPSITVQDQVSENIYPMAITAKGTDDVYIGRIRRDFSVDNGINIWVVADNIRKGAATNAVQIAEVLINKE